MNILIVGDGNENGTSICNTLGKYKPEWQLSLTGEYHRCLAMVRSGNSPHVVILDIDSVNVSNLELIQHIRDDSDVPIIVLSNDRDIPTLVKVFNSGASDYVIKPFNDQVLVARLKSLIRRRAWDVQAEEAALMQ